MPSLRLGYSSWPQQPVGGGGHSGFVKTIQRVRRDFYWLGLKSDVKQFIKDCDLYQRVKSSNTLPSGLQQRLPIPTQPWTHTSMDFIEGLPNSKGFNNLWVVVDRLTKYNHITPLKHPCTAQDIANLFLKHIFKLHGLPLSIVSDRDRTFTSNFWQELFNVQGV